MRVSNHAKMRMKQRCGLNAKSCERIARKAFEEGICHSQTKGQLNKWVTCLYFKNEDANNIRLYGDKAFIFCGEVLVTVIQIPNELKKNMQSMIKRK